MAEQQFDTDATVDVRRPGVVVSVGREDAVGSVVLVGELDLGSVDGFTSAVDEVLGDPPDDVVLDWSGLTFIDSSGVGAYVQVFRRARSAGVRLTLGARSPVVDRVLQLSGVEQALRGEAG